MANPSSESLRGACSGLTKCLDECLPKFEESKAGGLFYTLNYALYERSWLATLVDQEPISEEDLVDWDEDEYDEELEAGAIIERIAGLHVAMTLLEYTKPNIFALNKLVLPLWPGQPLSNFGLEHSVLEAGYWYVDSAASKSRQALGCKCQGIEDDFTDELESKLPLVISKKSEIAKWVKPIPEDDNHELVIERLWELYICRYGNSLPPGFSTETDTEQKKMREAFSEFDIKRVRDAMDDLGWDKKQVAIQRRCRMNRAKCFAIIRWLKAESTAEPRT